MSILPIKIEHGFVLHQNFWTWNNFHLGLKFYQKAAIYYAISAFLANAWTCLQGNQTSQRFGCMPPLIEKYLALQVEDSSKEDAEENQEVGK